jgi:carboxymethylenebutenolidase
MIGGMCFDADSFPPIAPIAGAAVSHEDLVLEAPDGNRFAAFDAVPDDHIGTGVVILPDVRGLYSFYEELALRFAERGVRALAIDYFGRTAGAEKRSDDWDFKAHVDQTRQKGLQADIGAAVHRLRSPEGGDCRAVFTVGYCFGGSTSWLAAAGGHGLSGAIGFYGRPGGRNEEPGPRDRAADMRGTPILGLMGGADPSIPAADIAAFEAELADAGVESEFVVYEDAPHSFFDRKQEEFAEASEDAWLRTLAFIAHHGGQDPR